MTMGTGLGLVTDERSPEGDPTSAMKTAIRSRLARNALARDDERCRGRLPARHGSAMTRKQVLSEFVNYADRPIPALVEVEDGSC